MYYSIEEILETVRMIQAEHLDIRTVTMGINLRGCVSEDIDTMNEQHLRDHHDPCRPSS